VVAVGGITVWRIADDLRRLVQVPLSIVAIGAWYWVTRTGVRRSIGITVFAAAVVAGSLPGVAAPLRTIASAVGYSRIHTGCTIPATSSLGR
jgi:hypothetical protein